MLRIAARRGGRRLGRGTVALWLAVCAGFVSDAVAFEGPTQLGKVELGAKVDAVQAAYPTLRMDAAGQAQTPVATGGPVPSIRRGQVREVALDDVLRPCDLTLAFFQDELYQMQARCELATDKILEHLRAKYGPQWITNEDGPVYYWQGTRSTLIFHAGRNEIGLTDNARNMAVFAEAVRLRATAMPSPATANTPNPAPTP